MKTLDGQTLLSQEDILNIPDEMLPMPILSDNIRSFISWGIKEHTKGNYNHFMWLYKKGFVASQDFLFSQQPVSDYFEKFRLKLWYCPSWTKEQRLTIIQVIEGVLAEPWYKRRYDILAIAGQLFNCEWLQIPWLDICSDKARLLSLVDDRYNLKHPDPQDVNEWLEKHGEYRVFGRYVPD